MTPRADAPEVPPVVLDFSALDRLPKDGELPYSDGEPMDTYWHGECLSLLIDSLYHHWRDRDDFFAGGDMFVYFSPDRVFHKDFRGPDFFVAKGVDRHKKRYSYITWRENSRLPSIIIELGSESTLDTDRGEKWKLYGDLRIPEYFIYDPDEPRLEGWRMTSLSGYVPIELGPLARMWSQELELWIGPWDGPRRSGDDPDRWLRFFDPEGNLVPTPAEAAQAAARAARVEARRAQAKADAAEAKADAAEAKADAEAAARAVAEQQAEAAAAARAAAEAELVRLRQELDALRQQQQPPTTP